MDEPVTGWRHTHAQDSTTNACRVFLPNDTGLLLYDPASTTGNAWLHTSDPVDLRAFA